MAIFLQATRNFKNQVTALNSFLAPAAAGLWNLRWQAKGYLDVHEGATHADLMGRFVRGSGVGSVNIRGLASTDWPDLVRELAKFGLFSACSFFEIWMDELGLDKDDRIQLSRASAALGCAIGPPDAAEWVAEQNRPGIVELLARMPRSELLHAAFPDEPGAATTDAGAYSLAIQVFREARNGLIHAGVASRRGGLTYDAFARMDVPVVVSKVKGKQHLSVPSLKEGEPIRVSYEQTIGLLSALNIFVSMVDANLGRSADIGEEAFVRRWRSRWPNLPQRTGFGMSDSSLRTACTELNYPRAADAGPVRSLLGV